MLWYRNRCFTAMPLVMVLIAAIACFSAAPTECIEAAESAGLPDAVIGQLRNPEDLNAIERAALNRVLSQAGIDDICAVASETAGSGDIPNFPRSDHSGPEGTQERAEPENARDGTEPIQQTVAAQRAARIPENDEHRRRCKFWALDNLQPVVYAEFSKLDPDRMDDLDRILWRTKLNSDSRLGFYVHEYAGRGDTRLLLSNEPGIYCRDYWAEPINDNNANLRNHAYEPSCRMELENRIVGQYNRLAEVVNYQDGNELVYQTPNQYVRILQWLEQDGKDLQDSDHPPYRILEEQSGHRYAYYDDYSTIPTEPLLDDYRKEWGARLNLEWLGILTAAGLHGNSSVITYCHYYYPQVFYGYWIPFDPDQAPVSNQEPELDLPQYEPSATPLYLPKSVTAARVRVGYPLGLTGERYHLCRDSGDAEASGYYYVSHPAGDYCERIP